MKCVVVILIATLAAVECKPRPQGLGLPDTSIPTGPNDSTAVQPDVSVGEDGAVEVKETKTTKTETAEENSDHSAQGYEHTGADGSTVNQSSEKNSTHAKTEKEERTESKAVKVGPQGGLTMTEDKTTTRDKTEENSETGRQSYKESSGNDPNHQHTFESGSQYENSNQTHDHHQETSHNQMSLTPDLQTKSEHDETTSDQHEEKQKEEGSSYARQEDYDKDNNKITHSRAESGSAYKSEANTSTNNSTSKHQEKNSNGGANDNINENTNNGEGDKNIHLGDVVGSQSETNIDTNARSEMDASNEETVSEESEKEIDSNGGGEIDANNENESEQSQSEMQIDSNAAGERDENRETGVEVQQDEETGNDKGSMLQTNMGHKFHVDEELYKELDRDERALGIIKDDPDSTESVEQTDYFKIRNDFLLAVAQNIHNSRIVGDENGNARIVSPHQYSEEQSDTGNFLNVNAPYRTLAQKYGASPVSSHYANAQLIESRFGNIPSFFNLGLTYDKSKTIENQYGEENDKYRKSQNKLNFFEKGSELENSILKLQLSPSEWEERVRKESEMKDLKLSSYKAKLAREGVKKQDNIDPLVKNAILSQDLDDILGSAHTSAEINSAMKAFIGQEVNDIPMSSNIKNELNTNNINVQSNSPDENDIFGYSKDTHLEKDNFDASETSLDAFKDISQVITNQVDLVTPNDKFAASIISENIMENALGQPGFVSIGDVFEDRANNVIIDSFDNPRPQIISDNNSDEATFVYETTGKSYINSEVESNTMESVGLYSSFSPEVDKVDKDNSLNSTESFGSIETQTEKNSLNGKDKTKTISMTETTLSANDMNTATESNFKSENLSQNNNQIDNTPDKEPEVNSTGIHDTQINLSANETLSTSDSTKTSTSFDKTNQEEANKTTVFPSQETIEEGVDFTTPNDQMNISNSNVTLSEFELSMTEMSLLYNDSFIINNDTNVFESQSKNVDGTEIKEADTYFTTEKTDTPSQNITSEVGDFNKSTDQEIDISTDDDSVIIDASDDISHSKTKVDSNFGDVSNMTVLDKLVTDNKTAVNLNINSNMSPTLSQKIVSEVDSNSTFSNDNATVIVSSEDTENVSETIVTENDDDNKERSERLFNRSLLENDEEYNLENTTKTNNDNNKNETATLNETSFKPELNSTTVKNETDVSDNILNTTNAVNVDTTTSSNSEFAVIEVTKNSENYRDNSTTEIVESDFQEKASTSETVAVSVNVSNITDTSTSDTSTELNLSVEVANDTNRLEETTIATTNVLNELKVESNKNLRANDLSNTDVNTTLGPDNSNTLDTTTLKNKSDDLNIFTEETAKAEPNVSLDHATEEAKDAGTADNTLITAVDFESTTIINGVDQSTEGTVGNVDKTGELLIKSDKSQTNTQFGQSDTDESEMLTTTDESDKSETDQSVTSKVIVDSVKLDTDKSETSKTDIDSVKLNTDNPETSKADIASGKLDKSEKSKTVESDDSKSDKSVKLETNESEKSRASVELDKSTVKPVKSEAIVKTDKFIESVKAERENEESGSYVEDSTSKSDESSVSLERVFAIRSLGDYSGSGSAEK